MDYIERNVTGLLRRNEAGFKCLLVTGPRQCGKSTLLQRLFPDRRYVTLDDPFLAEQAQNDPSLFVELNPPPVIFDEVQHSTALFPFLKIRCDESQTNGLFCLSGSQPFELMRNVSETLAGRVSVVELSTLSLREIQGQDCNDPFVPTSEYIRRRAKTAVKPDNIWQIIHRGGYPALQDPRVEWSQFFASYVKTYLERDIRSLSAVQNLDDYRRFMVAVAARTGQILNYANIADEVGRDAKTVKNWVALLEASGIIYLLEPYAASTLKRTIKAPKLYFRDTGLAAYLTRWLTPETLAVGAMSGAMFETFVIGEIIKSYANRGIDYRYAISYYRGRDKQRKSGQTPHEGEIDLIIEENGRLHPVEVKQSTRPNANQARAFRVLRNIPERQLGEGAIVCLAPSPARLEENLWVIPAWYI